MQTWRRGREEESSPRPYGNGLRTLTRRELIKPISAAAALPYFRVSGSSAAKYTNCIIAHNLASSILSNKHGDTESHLCNVTLLTSDSWLDSGGMRAPVRKTGPGRVFS